MLQDKFNIFADAQSIVGTAATRIPSTSVDLVKAGDAKAGSELIVRIQIQDTVLASGGAANVTFSLETYTSDSFATARTVLWKSAAIAKAILVAGYVVARLRLPPGALRYLNVVALPDTHDTTAGAIDAFLTPADQDNDL